MTGPTYTVLVMIAHHESEDRGAFPSIDRLAMESRCSTRTVQEAIGRAKKAGELEVQYRAGPNGTNIYRTLCGARGAAPLYAARTTPARTPQELHPAAERRPAAPELKELGVTGSVVSSNGVGTEVSAPAVRSFAAEFAEFWKAYPIRKGKGAAERKYRAARKRASAAEILAGVQRYVAELAANPDLPPKYAEGWLNADRWLDEDAPSATDNALRLLQANRGETG
jgi:hypothetical protein